MCRELKLDVPSADLTEWNEMLKRIEQRNQAVRIALVGKYVKLHDAYLSVAEALHHGGYENGAVVEIKWIDSEDVTLETAAELLEDCQGILVPGGFGDRGVEGMIITAKYARENNIPYLGICLGMQVSVIEFARSLLGFQDANSSEFTPEGCHNVIDLMPDQQGNLPKGGTMRLGAYPCQIKKNSILDAAYGTPVIQERHRHRYEFNNQYREQLEAAGLMITGTSPDNHLVEAIELPENSFYVGVQYHPEFKSRPNRAHPLFRAFVKAALANKDKN